MTIKDDGNIRSFETGATRDTSEGKLAYNGFYSPFVMRQFARFMNMNRLQSDGQLRDANNWQKGIPMEVYRESLSRHYMEFWQEVEIQEGIDVPREGDIKLMAAACGLMFNIQGYVLEWLKKNPEVRFDDDEPTAEMQERQDKLEKPGTTHDVAGCPDCIREVCCKECGCEECICEERSVVFEHLGACMCQGCIEGRRVGDQHRQCGSCRWLGLRYDDHPCDCCTEEDPNYVFDPRS